MRYRVRTPEGELEYESLLHVEQAYLAGLVDPEDEVLEEGGTLWRKAATLPILAQARPVAAPRHFTRTQPLVLMIAVLLAVFSLLLVWSGKGLFGLLIAMVVVALLWRITFDAFRPKR